jgi:hypothetical protein
MADEFSGGHSISQLTDWLNGLDRCRADHLHEIGQLVHLWRHVIAAEHGIDRALIENRRAAHLIPPAGHSGTPSISIPLPSDFRAPLWNALTAVTDLPTIFATS